MAENGYGAPMAGHVGRIPNYGKTQVNPMGNYEPPACIQNAMMTKDKKPFTYTPGGLDLSQIKTPSMARRLARQRSQEEHEQAYAQQHHPNGGGNYRPQGGPPPPPPPPMKIPAPPPPPPLIIETSHSKSPNAKPTVAPGERPEIVIPENPIGMLRKTNSPYHWEAEKAELNRIGPVPKFVEKVPSPLTVKMPPSSFSQQPPQSYTPQNNQRSYPYSNANPESPLHKPEAQYANKNYSPIGSSPNTRDFLQRQDSQFNKSPDPYAVQSPISNGSPFSPSPNTSWRQPEKRDSPVVSSSPHSPFNRGQFSPSSQQYSPNQNQTPPSPAFHTLPRANHVQNNNVLNNKTNVQARPQSPQFDTSNPTPWRTSTLGRPARESETQQSIYHNSQPINQQPAYTPPWQKTQEVNNNQEPPQWKQNNKPAIQTQQYNPPWETQNSNNNRVQENNNSPWRSNQNSRPSPPKQMPTQEPRYQSSISIPVTPRKPKPEPEYNNTPPQKEVVYVNQEPVFFCPDSPKAMPGFVKAQKEKTKTSSPIWCQRPFEEPRKSLPRELVTPPRETLEPEWVKRSNDMQRGAREVVSPPTCQQSAHPSWSTKPSDNRKSLPRDGPPNTPPARVIPIQMEVSSTESRNGRQGGYPQPQLRITIGMQSNPNYQQSSSQGPLSQPTQRIMRVLSPQLVRMEDAPATQPDLPTLNRSFQNSQESQPKTRIIPIQIEGGNDGPNKRVLYHKFTQEAPPRQSKAFRVLQVITGTQDEAELSTMEYRHGFTDL